jgi:hypothetical protein
MVNDTGDESRLPISTGKKGTTAKLAFWLFENPPRYTQLWAKQVRGIYPVHIWQ